MGATSNPTIVGEVLKKEMHLWRDRIAELIAGNPTATEDEIAWMLIEEMAVKGAELLLPVFEREGGRKGRLSIQTNPKFYRDAARITEQAVYFATLAPNMQVKIPGTHAGMQAVEEATAAGVTINATVCFTVPQAIAVAEAVERGLRAPGGRRRGRLGDVAGVHDDDRPAGRLDEGPGRPGRRGAHARLRQLGRDRLPEEGVRDLPGARLSGAAAGGGLPAPPALVRADRRRHRDDDPLQVAAALQRVGHRGQAADGRPGAGARSSPSCTASCPTSAGPSTSTGCAAEEFDSFGATARTLRGFIGSYQDLVAMIRDFMIPNPDLK